MLHKQKQCNIRLPIRLQEQIPVRNYSIIFAFTITV